MKKIFSIFLILTFLISPTMSFAAGSSFAVITAFDLKKIGTTNSVLTNDVIGKINEDTKEIILEVPFEARKTPLIPTIVISRGATISPAGGTVIDFSDPEGTIYKVISENNSYSTLYNVIVVEDPAPNVTTEPATNITSTSVTLNASVRLGPLGGTYRFLLGETSTYENLNTDGSDNKNISPTPEETIDTNREVASAISGLKPGTLYYFNVYAVTAGGDEKYGNPMTFTTLSTGAGSGNASDKTNPTTPKPKTNTVDLSYHPGGFIDCPDVINGCNFNDLMQTVNNVIKFLLFWFATPLAALCFAYAGFLYLTSGGSSENKTKAIKIIKNVVIGYVIALAAWLIVVVIMKTLGFTGAGEFLDIVAK